MLFILDSETHVCWLMMLVRTFSYQNQLPAFTVKTMHHLVTFALSAHMQSWSNLRSLFADEEEKKEALFRFHVMTIFLSRSGISLVR